MFGWWVVRFVIDFVGLRLWFGFVMTWGSGLLDSCVL